MSDRDFGKYNCTARNNIGMRFQEFILAQAGESGCVEVLPQMEPSGSAFPYKHKHPSSQPFLKIAMIITIIITAASLTLHSLLAQKRSCLLSVFKDTDGSSRQATPLQISCLGQFSAALSECTISILLFPQPN